MLQVLVKSGASLGFGLSIALSSNANYLAVTMPAITGTPPRQVRIRLRGWHLRW